MKYSVCIVLLGKADVVINRFFRDHIEYFLEKNVGTSDRIEKKNLY